MPFDLPLRGAQNPSSTNEGTNPGSFANAPAIGSASSFSSPDAPGMPLPSARSAWDFMPESWCYLDTTWHAPTSFRASTQLECARLGVTTEEMQRVAGREPHLSAEQIRVEVAAGRM